MTTQPGLRPADEVTGVIQQLAPDVEQVVGPEVQEALAPDTVLPVIGEPDKRIPPIPSPGRPTLPPVEIIQQEVARQTIIGFPVVKIDRYTGTDLDWQMLLRWDIPPGLTGDLHELSLRTSNPSKTRYRIVFAGRDQGLPVDKDFPSLFTLPWRQTIIPGPVSVTIEVRSTDGTSITVDGTLTGSER